MFWLSSDNYPEVELLGPLSLVTAFVWKSILPSIIVTTPAFLPLFFACIFMKYLFPSLYFQSVCVFHSPVPPVGGTRTGLVFLSIQPPCVWWLGHLIHLHLEYLLTDRWLLPFYYSYFLPFFLLFKEVPLTFLVINSFSFSCLGGSYIPNVMFVQLASHLQQKEN